MLAVDASLGGWGAVLMQLEPGTKKRHPARYESDVWIEAEALYDAGKRECRGLLKALKKFRFWLYGVHFILETDANTLAAQLNRTASDLPGTLVIRWLVWIRLFDFEDQAADALSRRPATSRDTQEAEHEVDVDDWIEAELQMVCVLPA
jgi:RNase H-like domain found in reverse transcriptase